MCHSTTVYDSDMQMTVIPRSSPQRCPFIRFRGLVFSFMLVCLNACDCEGPPLADTSADASVPGPDSDAAVTNDSSADSGPWHDGDAGSPSYRPDGGSQADAVFLLTGPDVPNAVSNRIESLLRAASVREVVRVAPDTMPRPNRPNTLWLAVGNTGLRRELIGDEELSALGSEGYLLRSGMYENTPVLVADGNARSPDPYQHGSLGDAFAAFALLEHVGFAFLHPLEPTLPLDVRFPTAPVDLQTHPHWDIRGTQLHTMHPLELTDLLNGWGILGPDDLAGFESMQPEWDRMCEWLLANGQNHVQWVLLESESWQAFARSEERQSRLRQLVSRAHEYGLVVGVDVPIALHQQHAFRLLRNPGDEDGELAEIRSSIDWLMAAGFDYLATESGHSEFTHPDGARMLAWMNEVAQYLDSEYGSRAYIKVHASTGQEVEGFVDEDTQENLNFNFLPHYADPRLGVMPHTVQHYALDDPAPTYGNEDFSHIREFLQEEAGLRETLWHPETAYWVSFDVDVPLFLPVYADRRLHDLWLLANDEITGQMGRGERAGARMNGQMNFSSGFEWGYWLNDVMTARAAWNPHLDAGDENAARARLLQDITRVFGSAGPVVQQVLEDTMEAQRELLIAGQINGAPPADIDQRNGQAYLQGWETFDEISDIARNFGIEAMTQPDKLGLVDMRNPLHPPPGYSAEVAPLLTEMETRFVALADTLAGLEADIPPQGLELYRELRDGLRITALRATQVHGLYDYVDGYWDQSDAERALRLSAAQDALDEALVVVSERETHYRVPVERIAGWRENPTAYEFTYLWTVHSLFYWWRDEGKAYDVPLSPCYLNIINPVDVGFGEGIGVDVSRVARELGESLGWTGLAACLAETREEPTFPQVGVRGVED